MARSLAYLFPTFPVLHQTFTLREVLGLQKRGYPIALYSLKRTRADLQQPEAVPLIEQTTYCPPLLSGNVRKAFRRAMQRRPREVAGLFLDVVAAWRSGRARDERPGQRGEAVETLSWSERLLAVYHHNAWIYLCKSLVLVPYAIYLAEKMERRGVVHVHAHWATYATTVAWLIKRWAGIPYSFTAHAYDIYMIRRMLPTKLREATFVVTCASANRAHLASLVDDKTAERVFVNYHGTDLSRFRPATRRRTNAFRIMSCGWLKEYKGFHYLIEALRLLVDEGIDARLDLAGDGPQREYLRKRAEELGVSERVTFHGYLSQERLSELYRASDVFVQPSIVMGRYGRQDVIPNVLAEAMASGVPVVATRVGGIEELVEDGRQGLLVPERSSEALARALARLWNEPELASSFAVAGRAKVEKIWDRERNLDALAKLIEAHVPGLETGLAA